jgi:hypothetical protein
MEFITVFIAFGFYVCRIEGLPYYLEPKLQEECGSIPFIITQMIFTLMHSSIAIFRMSITTGDDAWAESWSPFWAHFRQGILEIRVSLLIAINRT